LTVYFALLLEYLPMILGVFTLAYAIYSAWKHDAPRTAVCFVICILTFVLGV